MYSFRNDYSEGAHPLILEALQSTNYLQSPGYGEDDISQQAKEAFRNAIGQPNADIHFFVGGTIANLTAISAFLKPYQAAITAATGHIYVHEAGAIEATGHKAIPIETQDGKLTPSLIAPIIRDHTSEHMVMPKLVYISNVTEVGTVYTKAELQNLSSFCKENSLILYLDGARLAQALYSGNSDLSLEEVASLTDAFYLGGTKNGLLFGEALSIQNPSLKEGFRHYMKRSGAILAKGRLLGIQFLTAFKSGLMEENALHANQSMSKVVKIFEGKGISFLYPPQANMCFPILKKSQAEKLAEAVAFEDGAYIDEKTIAIRLVTSWATKEEAISALESAVSGIFS